MDASLQCMHRQGCQGKQPAAAPERSVYPCVCGPRPWPVAVPCVYTVQDTAHMGITRCV